MTTLSQRLDDMFSRQIGLSRLFYNNFQALNSSTGFNWEINGFPFNIQFNPQRILSASANIDKQSLIQRKCFLCRENRPDDQLFIPYNGKYEILVNPYPIFDRHFTIAAADHLPQLLDGRIDDMLSLALEMPNLVLFYNGPKCGASAPDHFHFQAGNKGFLSIEKNFNFFSNQKNSLKFKNRSYLYELKALPFACVSIEGDNKDDILALFENLMGAMVKCSHSGEEPMMNILCWYENKKWIVCVFPRRLHRPRQYFACDEQRLLISPGSVEMGGTFVIAREEDYNKITRNSLIDILEQISFSQQQMSDLIRHL